VAVRGFQYSRGGIDRDSAGIGPVLSRVRSPHGPNGAMVTGGDLGARGGRSVQSGGGGGAAAPAGVGVSPLVVVMGLIGLAGILWLARKNSEYLQQNTLGLNSFNVVTIGIVASVWIILSKIAFNKVPIPGVTPVINAI
jgi:hypothetical protein